MYNNNTGSWKKGRKGREDWKNFYLHRVIVDKFKTHFVVHMSACECVVVNV